MYTCIYIYKCIYICIVLHYIQTAPLHPDIFVTSNRSKISGCWPTDTCGFPLSKPGVLPPSKNKRKRERERTRRKKRYCRINNGNKNRNNKNNSTTYNNIWQHGFNIAKIIGPFCTFSLLSAFTSTSRYCLRRSNLSICSGCELSCTRILEQAFKKAGDGRPPSFDGPKIEQWLHNG